MQKPDLVIIGLGNPGASYECTRHNAGFLAASAAAASLGATEWRDEQKFLSRCATTEHANQRLLFALPTTFMNRSGECAAKIVSFFKLDPSRQVLIVYDDIDLPLGDHRYRVSGGPGTHNGMKSIVDVLGENVPRFRIGIGPAPNEIDLAAWVLSRLSTEEQRTVLLARQPLLEVIEAMVGQR